MKRARGGFNFLSPFRILPIGSRDNAIYPLNISNSASASPPPKRTDSSAAASSSSSAPNIAPRQSTQLRSGRFDSLNVDCIQVIFLFLVPTDVISFTLTCKRNNEPEITPPYFWKNLLNSPLVDPFNEYKNNDYKEKKVLFESEHGYRKIAVTLL